MNQEIKEICDGLMELYETSNPFSLCRQLGVEVIETNLGDNILGFFQRIDGEEIIYLNNTITNHNEKEYVCLHELGHVICHPELSISFLEKTLYVTNKYENEADMFAAYFLMPDSPDLLEVDSMTINQLSSYFKVPEHLIKLRFEHYSYSI